jgi:hypothetical protein
MASSLELEVAGQDRTIQLDRPDAEVRQILRWFLQDKFTIPPGLTNAQENQLLVDTTLAHLVLYVSNEAKRNRLAELQQTVAGFASIAQMDTDL